MIEQTTELQPILKIAISFAVLAIGIGAWLWIDYTGKLDDE